MSRLLAGVLILTLAAPVPPPPPAPVDGELQAGIALVKEGDFEAAVLKLDGAIRTMEADPGAQKDLATAYLYLGVAYLELEQELSARTRFRQAVGKDPALRLDPKQFSPQVIRTFEAARAELGPRPIPSPSPSPRATAARPAPAGQEPKKGGSGKIALVVLGVAGAGAAAAFGLRSGRDGGSGSTTVPTTTPSATTAPTTTPATTTPTTTPATTTPTTEPTTTTTTTMRPACTYAMRGPSPPNPYPAVPLGGGSCNVDTAGGCAWTVTPSHDWIRIQNGSGVGSGSGTVNFTLTNNTDVAGRNGSISVVGESASCEIRQNGILGAPPSGGLALTSELGAVGASGHVVVNGTEGYYLDGGITRLSLRDAADGPRRVAATLVTAASRPGLWRFQIDGLRPGTLRVIAGEVVLLTGDAVSFRLAGRPGERVVFTFQAVGQPGSPERIPH